MEIPVGRNSHATRTATLQRGDAAPPFTLHAQDRKTWRLSDMRGRKTVVLAFYPFAFSEV